MRALIVLLFLVYPLTILGVFVEGKLVSLGQVVTTMVAAGAVLQLLLLRYKVGRKTDGWILGVLLLLGVGAVSILFSPYGERAAAKGVIQLAGITIAALTALAIRSEVRRDPEFFPFLIRLSSVVLGLLGFVGVVQFVYFNAFGSESFLNFSFMNEIAGGSVWRDPGKVGALYRANSIFAEPAHFTRYLGLACGVALIRMGLLGKRYQRSISKAVPLWSSWCIIAGYVVSLSLLGYALLALIGLASWGVSHNLGARSMSRGAAYLLLSAGVVYSIGMLAGPEFEQKVSTLNLILASDNEDAGKSSYSTVQASALAVAVNYEVMKANVESDPILGVGLGGHPVAYREKAPPYALAIEDITGLNADDAASLLFRLLSETGILGTAAYIAMVAFVALRARAAILRRAGRFSGPGDPVVAAVALSIGVTGSLISVFAIYLARAGQYYELPLWLLLSLAICVPQLLRADAAPSGNVRRKPVFAG